MNTKAGKGDGTDGNDFTYPLQCDPASPPVNAACFAAGTVTARHRADGVGSGARGGVHGGAGRESGGGVEAACWITEVVLRSFF